MKKRRWELYLGCILWRAWIPADWNQTTIIGYWAEDGNPYEIEVPAQLRSAVIEMQNMLAELYIKIGVLQTEIKRITELFDVKG